MPRAKRMAVIGCGGMGSMHGRALRRHAGELVCCDVAPDRAQGLGHELGAAVRTSVEDAIAAGLDAAVVATATDTHPEVVGALLAAGVPTFCEKPLAMTLEETAAIGRLADAHGVFLQVGFHRRFDPGYLRVRQAVRDGSLGRVNMVRAGTHEEPERAVPVERSGSVLRDLLIHDFDALRFVTGAEATAVTTAGVEGHSGVGDGRDWPAVASLVELADGSVAVVTGGRPNPPGYDARIEVYGTAGSVAAGLDERTPAHPRGPGGPPPYAFFADRFPEAYEAEIAGFVAGAEGGENRCPWRDAHEALRLSVAAERSLVERRRVELRDVA
jgi:myo-inositol 2-dehydrogenase / D-chiro-inositol 1-dehydrogenase